MMLFDWAKKNGIPHSALMELIGLLGCNGDPGATSPSMNTDGSESSVQSMMRLNASKLGHRLWRNNVGAGKLDNGSFIRWGLMNDTKQMNDTIKSPDLVGIKKVPITPDMIGSYIGQFYARECKPAGWYLTGTAHEMAQLRAIELIVSLGGDARFCTRGDEV